MYEAVRKLSESVHLTNFFSPRWSQKRRACHVAYSSAVYTLAALSSVQKWEAPRWQTTHSALRLLLISVHKGVFLDEFLSADLNRRFNLVGWHYFMLLLATSSRKFGLRSNQGGTTNETYALAAILIDFRRVTLEELGYRRWYLSYDSGL